MGKIIYISGGARSGKSSFAEKKVLETEKKKIYVATGIPFDDEMKERVRLHKIQRGDNWITIESYKNIEKYLSIYENKNYVVLLDCLTNFVSNNIIMDRNIDWDTLSQEQMSLIENEIENSIKKLIDFIKKSSLDMVVVSNEVGMGIIPPYRLGRYFRDVGGKINQIVAHSSDEAYLVISGLELKLK